MANFESPFLGRQGDYYIFTFSYFSKHPMGTTRVKYSCYRISLRFGGLSSNVTGPRNRCSSAFLLQQQPPAIQEVHANSTSGTKFFSPISASTSALKQEGARIGPAVHPGGVFRTLFHSSQVYASLRQASEGDERWS